MPLHSAEHFYIVTKPFTPPIPPTLPVLRDPDAYGYYREWSGGLVYGGFEPKCKPLWTDGAPTGFEFALLPDDWDHFSQLMEGALERVPALETAEVKMVNGPESFTADNQYILGEAPEVRRFYVAAGFNSSGIASAGGAGKALSEWIVSDGPTMDLWSVDIRRFARFHGNTHFLRERTSETLGLHYQINWPKRELESARGVRRSPLYDRLKQSGAVFGSKFGWERPLYFAADNSTEMKYSFGRPTWFDDNAREHVACRQSAALFDLTSFSKYSVSGRDALTYLQRMCSNDVDVSVGRIVYTPMLNDNGGYECDCTVTRIADDEFFIVSSTTQATRDISWMKRHVTLDEHVHVADVTSGSCCIAIMGPLSRQIMAKAAHSTDWSNEAFPFGTAQTVDVGFAVARAHRITYVGELGYEVYVPTEMSLHVYESIQNAAKDLSVTLTLGGYYAVESLRIEKGYRAWAHELSTDTTPLEAGLSFTVKWEKADFKGRKRLAELYESKSPLKRRLVHVVSADADLYLLGDEPLLRNDVIVGYLSSAAYGHTLGRSVAMAFVKSSSAVTAEFISEAQWAVITNGHRSPVNVSLRAPYDPINEKIKS